ncbi:MAG: methyltransferase [Bacteroidales bacterium]|nr:methyltransferase [Bacteroidales bacterium]
METGLEIAINDLQIKVNRPEPIIGDIEVVIFSRKGDPKVAVNALMAGNFVLVTDFYSSGLLLLNELKVLIKNKYPKQSFLGQREFRDAFRELSNRILLVVYEHKLEVKKAPDIGWLKILYPELSDFLLPFPQIQGLNSAWQWYKKGISIPTIDVKIYPFYGTYFPTRFEHLHIFDQWLKRYNGKRETVFDVGIGSGVLSFLLYKHGFAKVFGSDSNPNAIIGLNEVRNKIPKFSELQLFYGDLFAGCQEKAELVVFNPPWLPALHNAEGIDKAIYYDGDLFPRFFNEAVNHLSDEGRIVLLFSNLGHLTHEDFIHPILDEIQHGGRFEKELFIKKNVGAASVKTKRDQNWRTDELVELWVLKPRKSHQNA